jgi:hypothetical protein
MDRSQKDLVNEEECVKDDRFREGDRQDRLHENRRRRARVTADGRSRAQTGKAYANAAAHGRKSYVNVATHLCQ